MRDEEEGQSDEQAGEAGAGEFDEAPRTEAEGAALDPDAHLALDGGPLEDDAPIQEEAEAVAEVEVLRSLDVEEDGAAGDPDADHGDDGAEDAAAAGVAGEAAQLELPTQVPEALPSRLKGIVGSLLFAADKPLPVKRIKELCGERDGKAVRAALEALAAHLRGSGIVLCEIGDGYQLRTDPENGAWVQRQQAVKPVRLTRAQLEVLAIMAYRQPITRPEIDEIRGVDCASTVKMLLERGLVRVLGHKEEPGRPQLYGTTDYFLEFFNLKSLTELPTLREFHELSEESRARVDALATGDEEAAAPPATASAHAGVTAPAEGERPEAVALAPPDPKEEEELMAELDEAAAKAERVLESTSPPKPPGPPEPGPAQGA